eukprot:5061345-Prymnesium_polylepis.1
MRVRGRTRQAALDEGVLDAVAQQPKRQVVVHIELEPRHAAAVAPQLLALGAAAARRQAQRRERRRRPQAEAGGGADVVLVARTPRAAVRAGHGGRKGAEEATWRATSSGS